MADDKNPQMFPALPDDLTALSDEELEALAAEHLQIIELAHARDEETLGARSAEEIIEQVTAGVTALEQIKGEQTARVEGELEFVSALDGLAQQAGLEVVAEADEPPAEDPEDPEADPEEEPADPEAVADPPAEEVEEPVAIAASSKPLRRPLPNPARHRPGANGNVDQGGLLARVASPEIGVEYGDMIGRKKLGQLMSHLVTKRKLHDGHPVTVASVTYDFPEERVLDSDINGNSDKINAVTGPTALVASGGLCAPLTPIYDLPGVETAERPVLSGLPSFQASRGGVIVGATPTMGTYADAVGIMTNANNEAGGSLAVKNCMRIECPEFEEVVVDAIYKCIEADNLASRAYPELMSRIDELVRAEHARKADGRLLGIIREGSTAVTGIAAADGGAIYNLLGDIAALAAGYRSRHRMPTSSRLQAFLPAYLGDMLSLDSSRAAARQGEIGRGQIAAYLERFAISVTWYIDTPIDEDEAVLGTSQIWAAQTAGARLQFPTETQWGLWAPGTWLHLDSGQLDLGIVRDSSLNSTNDFQQFAETWEFAAFVGVESIWATSTLCANGTFAAGVDNSAVCD